MSHKQLEFFTIKESDSQKKDLHDMECHTFQCGKISMSSTPMSFDLAVEVLKNENSGASIQESE